MQHLDFEVTKNLLPRSADERKTILAEPDLGTVFTDHMVDLCWSEKGGWHRPRVQPYGPLSLDPATAALHYAQEIFEGIKAYRWSDGSIWTFRPEANAKRLQTSSRRLMLPELPTDYFVQSLEELIAVDHSWVPSAPETSLYMRPFMFGKEAFLGVRAAKKVGYYVIATPAGPYFRGGVEPIKVWIETSYSRAANGGLGAVKAGANYAASLLTHQKALDRGYPQELYLDAVEHRFIEELGGMNIVLVRKDGSLLVPDSPTILPSITRDSVIRLATDQGREVEITTVALEHWRAGIESGDITEAFACGTAAIITPISELVSDDFSFGFPSQEPGELTVALRDELLGIQYGVRDDPYGWMHCLYRP